jgi:hypothetical protein
LQPCRFGGFDLLLMSHPYSLALLRLYFARCLQAFEQ